MLLRDIFTYAQQDSSALKIIIFENIFQKPKSLSITAINANISNGICYFSASLFDPASCYPSVKQILAKASRRSYVPYSFTWKIKWLTARLVKMFSSTCVSFSLMSFTTVVCDHFWTILSIFPIKESCCAFNKACMYEILHI